MAKDSLAGSYPCILQLRNMLFPSGSAFSAILSARTCMKHSVSRPIIPSTDTPSGVNEARCASAASLYVLFS